MTQLEDSVLTDEELARLTPRWHPLDAIGLVAGLVPFSFSFSESQTSSVEVITNGEVSSSARSVKHTDYVAIGGAVLALSCALLGLLLTLRRAGKIPGRKAARFAVFGALMLLGLVQLVRGFGLIQ